MKIKKIFSLLAAAALAVNITATTVLAHNTTLALANLPMNCIVIGKDLYLS